MDKPPETPTVDPVIEQEDASAPVFVGQILRDLADKVERGEILNLHLIWDGKSHFPECHAEMDMGAAYCRAMTDDGDDEDDSDALTPKPEEKADVPTN